MAAKHLHRQVAGLVAEVGERCLHDVVQPLAECDEGDYQLGRIAKSRIEQAPHPLAQTLRQLLGCLAEPSSQRNDADT